MNQNTFVNLRLFTSSSPAGMVDLNKAIDEIANNPDKYSPYIGLSNRNIMIDNVYLFKAAKSKGITPISAVELDLIHIDKHQKMVKEGFEKRIATTEEKERYSMLFVAKSFRGYQNICKMQTILYTQSANQNKLGILESVYQEYPELLEDVFVLSGGLNSGQNAKQHEGSYLFQKFVNIQDNLDRIDLLKQQNRDTSKLEQAIEEDQQAIEDFMVYWRNISNGNFFVELQRQGTKWENEFIEYIVPIANQLHIPVVATQNVYYLKKDEYEINEYWLAYRGGYTRYATDPNKLVHCTPENYLKTNQEIAELFADIPVAVENSLALAQECQLLDLKPIPKDSYHMPELKSDNPQETIDDLFIKMANDGLDRALLELFELYADPNSKFNKPTLKELEKKKNTLPDNEYFRKFANWKTSGLSIQEHGKEQVLEFIKNSALYNEYKERLDYEIGVIMKMRFSSYFVIVADMVQWAKNNNITVGIGRGSGAGSLVAYAMQITGMNPLQFDLLFERFLNPERNSMPDFDIDFEPDNRKRVFSYLEQKYNSLGVRLNSEDINSALDKMLRSPSSASIATLSKVGIAAGIELAGASLGRLNNNGAMIGSVKEIFGSNKKEDEEDLDGLTLLEDMEDEQEDNPSFFEKVSNSAEFKVSMHGKTFRELMRVSSSFYGLTRSFSSHAAGLVLSSSQLDDLVPIMIDKNGKMVIQADMKSAESLGLIKFDILGLLTLTYIEETLREINKTRKKEGLPTWTYNQMMGEINLYDPNVYEHIFKHADTSNVFQFESAGFQKTVRDVGPTNFDDLIALVALFRPGPLDQIPNYIKGKKTGQRKIYMPSVPEVDDVLRVTQSLPVYQEQIMQLLQVCAGFSFGEADIVRRAMGKKDVAEMQRQKQIFIDRTVEKWGGVNASPDIIRAEAIELFEIIEPFANYGFNKSHAAVYAQTAFITAWLKHYYPKEFYVAQLNVMFSHKKNEKIPPLIENIQKRHIDIYPTTDINLSSLEYTLHDGKIIPPLNLGLNNVNNANTFIQIRNDLMQNTDGVGFTSIQHMLDTCLQNGLSISENELRGIIESGALDSLHPKDFGNMWVNAGKLVKHSKKNNVEFSNPVYKYLPSKLLTVKPQKNNEVIVLDKVSREVPLSKRIELRVKRFGYLSDLVGLNQLKESYNKNLSVFKDMNPNIELDLSKIADSAEQRARSLKEHLFKDIENWADSYRPKDSDKNNKEKSNKIEVKPFYANRNDTIMTWGIVVNTKKTKNAMDLYIQLDNNEIVHIVSYNDDVRNTKFELMTPYLFKFKTYMDSKQKIIDVTEKPQSSDEIQLSWTLKDFFSIDNVLKQLSHSQQNENELPQLQFNQSAINGLLSKYGRNDIETQSEEIINLLYKSRSLSEKDIEKYESVLTIENDKVVNYNAPPIDVRLPNNEIVGAYFNDLTGSMLLSHGASIQFKLDNQMLLDNKLRLNSLEGNIDKSDNFANIKHRLEHNHAFNQILPSVKTIGEDFAQAIAEQNDAVLVEYPAEEYLLYGYLKNVYRRGKKDGIHEGDMDKLIVVHPSGHEITVNARFGRLDEQFMKTNLKTEQPVLLKINTFYQKAKGISINLLDFYTENDINKLFNQVSMYVAHSNDAQFIIDYAKEQELLIRDIADIDYEELHEKMGQYDKPVSIIKFSNVENLDGLPNGSNSIATTDLGIIVDNSTNFISTIQHECEIERLYFGDKIMLTASSFPTVHEKGDSSYNAFVERMNHINNEDFGFNILFNQFKTVKGINNGVFKLTDCFESIGKLLKHAVYNQFEHQDKTEVIETTVLATLIREEKLGNTNKTKMLFTDGSGSLSIIDPKYVTLNVNLDEYRPNGSKYGQPLVMDIKITKSNKGAFINLQKISDPATVLHNFIDTVYLKVINEEPDTIAKIENAILHAKQLQQHNYNINPKYQYQGQAGKNVRFIVSSDTNKQFLPSHVNFFFNTKEEFEKILNHCFKLEGVDNNVVKIVAVTDKQYTRSVMNPMAIIQPRQHIAHRVRPFDLDGIVQSYNQTQYNGQISHYHDNNDNEILENDEKNQIKTTAYRPS